MLIQLIFISENSFYENVTMVHIFHYKYNIIFNLINVQRDKFR